MKNEPQHLRELLWRRKLTDDERAEILLHPELAVDYEIEARLNETLEKIPDAEVPSNFTTRLMAVIDLEETRAVGRRNVRWNWHAWLPRIAVASAIVFFAGLTFQHLETNSRRMNIVQNVVRVAGSQPLPSMDALNNFDAIQRMSQPAPADEELLALLQ